MKVKTIVKGLHKAKRPMMLTIYAIESAMNKLHVEMESYMRHSLENDTPQESFAPVMTYVHSNYQHHAEMLEMMVLDINGMNDHNDWEDLLVNHNPYAPITIPALSEPCSETEAKVMKLNYLSVRLQDVRAELVEASRKMTQKPSSKKKLRKYWAVVSKHNDVLDMIVNLQNKAAWTQASHTSSTH